MLIKDSYNSFLKITFDYLSFSEEDCLKDDYEQLKHSNIKSAYNNTL